MLEISVCVHHVKASFFTVSPYSTVVHVMDDQSIETIRFFRVEQTYAVKTGKWYFEFEALSGGDMRVGWARPGCRPDVELGADDQVFVFDGYRVNYVVYLLLLLFFFCFFLPQSKHETSICIYTNTTDQ